MEGPKSNFADLGPCPSLREALAEEVRRQKRRIQNNERGYSLKLESDLRTGAEQLAHVQASLASAQEQICNLQAEERQSLSIIDSLRNRINLLADKAESSIDDAEKEAHRERPTPALVAAVHIAG